MNRIYYKKILEIRKHRPFPINYLRFLKMSDTPTSQPEDDEGFIEVKRRGNRRGNQNHHERVATYTERRHDNDGVIQYNYTFIETPRQKISDNGSNDGNKLQTDNNRSEKVNMSSVGDRSNSVEQNLSSELATNITSPDTNDGDQSNHDKGVCEEIGSNDNTKNVSTYAYPSRGISPTSHENQESSSTPSKELDKTTKNYSSDQIAIKFLRMYNGIKVANTDIGFKWNVGDRVRAYRIDLGTGRTHATGSDIGPISPSYDEKYRTNDQPVVIDGVGMFTRKTFSGTVIEQPDSSNHRGYLVDFDDGHSRVEVSSGDIVQGFPWSQLIKSSIPRDVYPRMNIRSVLRVMWAPLIFRRVSKVVAKPIHVRSRSYVADNDGKVEVVTEPISDSIPSKIQSPHNGSVQQDHTSHGSSDEYHANGTKSPERIQGSIPENQFRTQGSTHKNQYRTQHYRPSFASQQTSIKDRQVAMPTGPVDQNCWYNYTFFFGFTSAVHVREPEPFKGSQIFFDSRSYAELDFDSDQSGWFSSDKRLWECSSAPQPNDLVCGIVEQTNRGPAYKKWFKCSEQFLLLYTILFYPKHNTLLAKDGKLSKTCSESPFKGHGLKSTHQIPRLSSLSAGVSDGQGLIPKPQKQLMEELMTAPYLSWISDPHISVDEKIRSMSSCDLTCERAATKHSNVYTKIASAIWDPRNDQMIPLKLSWVYPSNDTDQAENADINGDSNDE